MLLYGHDRQRAGTIVPLTALTLVGLLGFVALAIDLGLVVNARNQCQNAADAAALAGARTLNGSASDTSANNSAQALVNATNVATSNTVLGQSVTLNGSTTTSGGSSGSSSTNPIVVGQYYYYTDPNNSANSQFVAYLPGVTTYIPGTSTPVPAPSSGTPYTMVQATISYTGNTAFAGVFGINAFNVSAVAQAAHRPRDISVIVDMSGSMRLDSLLGQPAAGVDINYPRQQSINPETSYPQFGHYSKTPYSYTAASGTFWQAPTGELAGVGNMTSATGDGPAVVGDFYAGTTAFDTSTSAFVNSVTPASTSYATQPGGDAPAFKHGSTTAYATNINDILGRTTSDSTSSDTTDNYDANWETKGYDYYQPSNSNNSTGKFNGYTFGPNYWGKTFFVWPPDPRGPSTPGDISASNDAKDWRQRFFIQVPVGAVPSPPPPAPTPPAPAPSPSPAPAPKPAPAPSPSPAPAPAPPTPPPPPPPLALLSPLVPQTGAQPVKNSEAYFMPAPEKPADVKPAFFASPPALPPSTGVIYNNVLFNSSGVMNTPGTVTTVVTPQYNPSTGYSGYKYTYQINYDAILYWLQNCGPNPFPSQLRSGGILYYGSIPSHIDVTNNWPPTDVSQRFWKDYIDEMLGFQQKSFSKGAAYQTGYQVTVGYNSAGTAVKSTGYNGYGPNYSWGTATIKAPPYQGPTVTVGSATVNVPSMDYRDNPQRPQTHFWFGPMTMLDFLGNFCVGSWNTNTGAFDASRLWWPGTCHEAPMWQCKIGMTGALNDMQTNHPNDYAALTLFSVPTCGNYSAGNYNYTPVPLGQNYNHLLDALWFAPQTIAGQTFASTGTTEMCPYDTAMNNVPRAIGGTCYAMPLMLAYNQFNSDPTQQTYDGSPPTTPLGQAGGLGRKGSQKLIIFETDGMVNAPVQSAYPYTTGQYYTNKGAYYSYYQVRQNDPLPALTYYDSDATTETTDICTQICAQYTAANPGYATPRKPVYIHTIAFGSLFDPTNNSSYKTSALALLAQMQTIGNTQPAGMNGTLPSYKQITGTSTQRISLLQQAFSTILQDGLQLTLIK